jgi:2'-5' RNA ligase
MSPRPDAESARLFIGLWPDAVVRARLAAYRDEWRWPADARTVADVDLHLTLHFIGDFERDRIAALGARLATVPVTPVQLRPDGTSVWRGGIAVLTMRGDAALGALHADIGAALRDCGVPLEDRPYAPHVTLARKAPRAIAPGQLPPMAWRATGFALVASRHGMQAHHEVLATWGAPHPPNGG